MTTQLVRIVTLIIDRKSYPVKVMEYQESYYWEALGKEGKEDTLDKALANARSWIKNKQ